VEAKEYRLFLESLGESLGDSRKVESSYMLKMKSDENGYVEIHSTGPCAGAFIDCIRPKLVALSQAGWTVGGNDKDTSVYLEIFPRSYPYDEDSYKKEIEPFISFLKDKVQKQGGTCTPFFLY